MISSKLAAEGHAPGLVLLGITPAPRLQWSGGLGRSVEGPPRLRGAFSPLIGSSLPASPPRRVSERSCLLEPLGPRSNARRGRTTIRPCGGALARLSAGTGRAGLPRVPARRRRDGHAQYPWL